MLQQAANALFMVEPTSFGFNKETAADNFFQKSTVEAGLIDIQLNAISEFENFVKKLKSADIQVFVKRHQPDLQLPDAVFPNNWISFLPGGTVIIFPMLAISRRLEKEAGLIQEISNTMGYLIKEVIDLSCFEEENKYLEGTGSIVFDHVNKTAFASISPRTNAEVLNFLCSKINYEPVLFNALDRYGRPVYHTNVVITITSFLVIICIESIKDQYERATILARFENSGHIILTLSYFQMESFAGNMLEVFNNKQVSYLIMSQTARNSLSELQVKTLEKYHQIMVMPISTIENTGGGSARCMMAEIFANGLINC